MIAIFDKVGFSKWRPPRSLFLPSVALTVQSEGARNYLDQCLTWVGRKLRPKYSTRTKIIPYMSKKGFGRVACNRACGLRCPGSGNMHPFQTLSETWGSVQSCRVRKAPFWELSTNFFTPLCMYDTILHKYFLLWVTHIHYMCTSDSPRGPNSSERGSVSERDRNDYTELRWLRLRLRWQNGFECSSSSN